MFVISASRSIRDEEIDKSIMITAYQMLRFFSKERKMQGSACEGYMKSNLESTRFIATSGIIFEASFDAKDGHFEIRFMLTESNIRSLEKTREYVAFMSDEGPESAKTFVNPVYEHFARN